MNRIDRISAILIHLQTKKIVKASEIADRFSISKRTVYRDIKALEEAGIPIGAEEGKGYFIVDGYHLPPVMFSKKEASSLMLAEKLVEKLTDKSTRENYQSAMYKIKSILPGPEKRFLEELNPAIEVFYNPPVIKDEFPNNHINDIQYAIANQLIINIDYFSGSKEEITKNRKVEPIGLIFYSLSWHLIAYCRLRNEYRDFRIDRIKYLSLTADKFNKRTNDNLRESFMKMYKASELIEVIIRFEPKYGDTLASQKYYYGFIDEVKTADYTEMYFLSNSYNYIGKWLLSHGNKAVIVSPENLKNLVNEFLDELILHYKTSQ